MALIFYGKTLCPICGKPIKKGQEIIAFPPFISNEFDPLVFFNDAAFHKGCFNDHPIAYKAQWVHSQVREHSAPRNRMDAVTGELIQNPDDYLGLGYLTDDESNPLFRYNFLHFNRKYLSKWEELPKFVEVCHDVKESGYWKGIGLDRVLEIMQAALKASNQ
jgi:hypothetical protein